MFAIRSGSTWEVRAPAKLNLLLEIVARREDGYHELETLMVPINLYDTLYLQSAPGGQVEATCRWAAGLTRGSASPGQLPIGSDNLAVRAVERLRAAAGIRDGARLRLVKRIPMQAGLGGASSDAAAALWAANLAWDLRWPRDALAELAAELGSDVPFFLGDGAAVCRGRGERITSRGSLGQLHFVVAHPPVGLATAAVYAACRSAEKPRSAEALVGALQRGALGKAGRLLLNRLQQPAESLSPWIGRLRDAFDKLDCVGHQMSGSGSSYFALCRNARHARRLAGRLCLPGLAGVHVCRSCR